MMSLPTKTKNGTGKHIVVNQQVHKKLKQIALYEDKTLGALLADFASNYKFEA